jgi:ParB family chromosome partitioning protein
MNSKKKISLAEQMKTKYDDRVPVLNPDLADQITARAKDASIESVIEEDAIKDKDGMTTIPTNLIDDNPYQPRKHIDPVNLNELAESIKNLGGLIQPIVVRRVAERYQLVVGRRRLLACRQIEFAEIPVIVRKVEDHIMAIIALDENLKRVDLSDYEIGQSIRNIESLFATKTEIAKYLKCNRFDVYRYTSFFELPSWVIARLDVNPKIIHRSNANELKKLINTLDYDESVYREHIEKAMTELETGALTQALFITRIKRLVRDAQNPRSQSLDATKMKFVMNGKKFGSLVHDDQGLKIKINPEALTTNDVEEIHNFILAKITGQPVK